MSVGLDEDYEQIIDAFASEETEEIVHVIQDDIKQNEETFEEDVHPSTDNIDDDTAIMVPPLLTTGRDNERIPITVNEMKRRIDPPEALCTTNLLHLLHLSKKRIPDVKETLGQYGLTDISKRSSVVSLFTKLSETEASHLAEDYYFLTSRSLKLKEIGDSIAEQNGGWEPFEAPANETKLMLEQILTEVEAKDKNFNQATHGFSPLIIRAIVDIVAEILTPKDSS